MPSSTSGVKRNVAVTVTPFAAIGHAADDATRNCTQSRNKRTGKPVSAGRFGFEEDYAC